MHHGLASFVTGGGNLDGCYEVFLAVGADFAYRQLAAGDDDGFLQILEHKAQRRGCECHSVGAVKHHKAVEGVVAVLYGVGNVAPMLNRHVRTVDRRVELDIANIVVEHF